MLSNGKKIILTFELNNNITFKKQILIDHIEINKIHFALAHKLDKEASDNFLTG